MSISITKLYGSMETYLQQLGKTQALKKKLDVLKAIKKEAEIAYETKDPDLMHRVLPHMMEMLQIVAAMEDPEESSSRQLMIDFEYFLKLLDLNIEYFELRVNGRNRSTSQN